MKEEKIGYKVSVFEWNEKEPDVLLFYHMSREEMNAWVDNLLNNSLNDITHVILEEFKVADYD